MTGSMDGAGEFRACDQPFKVLGFGTGDDVAPGAHGAIRAIEFLLCVGLADWLSFGLDIRLSVVFLSPQIRFMLCCGVHIRAAKGEQEESKEQKRDAHGGCGFPDAN